VSEDVLSRAERALAAGDVESALDALASYAERRGRGERQADGDSRWETLAEIAIEMGSL
jgi:hypothetical protein